ncbi:MAG: YfhO family protein [Candidatus Obscuribacterales bacterium]|nr:YfhO family protein [Candidatus Obscuribacterales bacterium]
MLTANKAKFLQKLKHFGILYGAFTALFLVFFAPVVLRGNLLAPDDDRMQSLPAFLSERTVWSPLLAAGWPVHADPLAQIWYPLSIILSKLPLPFGWNLFIVSGYSLCSVFLYLYVRLITGKRFPSIVAALVFPLSGSMLGELRHAPIIHSMAYLMALLFVVEKLSRRSSCVWLAAGIAALGLCVLNGHMQLVVYILVVMVLYTVFRSLTMKEGQSRFLLKVSTLICAGLAIGAIQILPTWELTRFSVRSKFAFIDFLSYACHPIQAIGLVTPNVFGAMNSSYFKTPYFGLDFRPPHFMYFGLLPMITLCAAFLLIRSNAVTLFWLVIGIMAFLLSFGSATPLAWILYNIPPFGYFRALSLFYPIAAASFAIVCGCVLSRLMDEKLARRRIIVFAATLFCLTCGAISLSVQILQEVIELPERGSLEGTLPPFWENPAILVPFYGAILILTVFLAWLYKPDWRPLKAALLVVAVADLAFVGWFNEWRSEKIPVASMSIPPGLSEYRDQLNENHQRLLPVRGVSAENEECPPNLSRLWKVPSASAFGPLLNTRYLEVLGITEGGFLPVPWTFTSDFRGFDILAIRYLVVPSGDKRLCDYHIDGKPIFVKAAEIAKADIFENTRAMPRVWMVGETRLMDDADVVRTIRRGELPDGEVFDPSKLALLSKGGMKSEGFVSPPSEKKVTNFSGSARVISIENRRVLLEAESSAGGFLVLSDLFYPGWKATVDGQPREIIRTNYVLRGLDLNAGKHSIEFRYEPFYLYLGAATSFLGLLLLTAVLWRGLAILAVDKSVAHLLEPGMRS